MTFHGIHQLQRAFTKQFGWSVTNLHLTDGGDNLGGHLIFVSKTGDSDDGES